MRKFWNWKEINGNRTLYLVGPISDETWWGDEVTPAAFKADLQAGDGPITVWINSFGGDVFAAAEIYTALKEYPGRITVKIDAVAASAASIVAMAGDEVMMSPVAHMIIHNPFTVAIGDSAEMQKAKNTLDAIKESIINAYESKTGLRRTQIGHMMTAETDMPAQKAVELGFADGILYANDARQAAEEYEMPTFMFSRMAVVNSFMDKLSPTTIQTTPSAPAPTTIRTTPAPEATPTTAPAPASTPAPIPAPATAPMIAEPEPIAPTLAQPAQPAQPARSPDNPITKTVPPRDAIPAEQLYRRLNLLYHK